MILQCALRGLESERLGAYSTNRKTEKSLAHMVLSRFSLTLPIALLLAWFPIAVLAAVPSIQDVSQVFRQGNNAVALEKVNALLAANPKDAQGRFLKGLILTELNRQIDAIKVFTDLTEDYPELPEPYNNLAVLYAAQGQYDRAKNSLEMAIRTHPSYATAHENLGDIYAKMASQSYDKALQLDKSNTSALTKLAMIREIFTPVPVSDAPKGRSAAKAGPRKAGPLAKVTGTALEPVRPQLLATRPESTVDKAEPSMVRPQLVATRPESTVDKAELSKVSEPVAPTDKGGAKSGDAAAIAEIERTVRAWAAAWGRRDAAAYLAFYGKHFKVPGGRERMGWEEERKARVTRPKFVKVQLDKIKVEMPGENAPAKASFEQHYVSNLVRSTDRKMLLLEKQGDDWKIVEER